MDLHILALETSSSVCGVALLSVVKGESNTRSLTHDATGEHAERLLPMVDQLLAQANIDRTQLNAVAFGQGPGGFTGLRVACGVAQGMAFALGIPVIPVASLLAVAALDSPDADPQVRVIVQDARMGEVYLAAYGPSALAANDTLIWPVLKAPILLNAGDVRRWIALQAPHWRDDQGRRLPVKVMGDALDAYPDTFSLAAAPADIRLQSGDTDTPDDPAAGLLTYGATFRPTAAAIARLAFYAWQRGETIQPEHAAPLYVRDKVAYTTLEREQGRGGNPKAGPLTVSIVPMTAACLDQVVEIERTVQSFPWTEGNFCDALQAGYGAWVARQEDKVVGFCLAMFAPDVAHLLLIAVARDEQKKGVGTLLLRHCEQESLSRGLSTVILEVRPSNLNALAFYRHHGFAQLSTRKDYYPKNKDEREDAWVLQKELADFKVTHG